MKDGKPIPEIDDLAVMLINPLWLVYFAGAQYVRKRMDFEMIAFLGTAIIFFTCVGLTVLVEETALDASDNGVFGFMQRENALLCFLGDGIICGFWGIQGYVLALCYYP